MSAFQLVPPEGIKMGRKYNFKYISIYIGFHTLQCNQRFTGIRWGKYLKKAIGYQTKGDATPDLHTYYESGIYFVKKITNINPYREMDYESEVKK